MRKRISKRTAKRNLQRCNKTHKVMPGDELIESQKLKPQAGHGFCGWLGLSSSRMAVFPFLGVGPCFGMTILCSSLPRRLCVRKKRSGQSKAQAREIPRLCQKIALLKSEGQACTTSRLLMNKTDKQPRMICVMCLEGEVTNHGPSLLLRRVSSFA